MEKLSRNGNVCPECAGLGITSNPTVTKKGKLALLIKYCSTCKGAGQILEEWMK